MARGLFTLKQHLQGLQQKAWTGTMSTPAVDYLVVAGGGSGKYDGYGGGGAGGLLQGSVPVTAGSAITVTVGAGGATGGGAGGNSVFGNISALGGAFAVQYGPATGGSGAGPFNWTSTGSQQQTFSTYGQGNDGGLSLLTSPSGSGGGGAGTKGLTGTSAGGGGGGAGIASAISGTVTVYAGGGGGGAYGVTTNASGGVGGGGIGNSTGGSSGTSGQTNTGGGGGAGNNAGGSGIVILSYLDIYAGAAAVTGSPTISTSGSGSMFFNGSTYLVGPTTSALNFGTGNYTVEFWVYPTAAPGSGDLDIYLSASAALNDFQIGFHPSQYLYSNFPLIRNGTSTSIVLNTWNHVALVRSGVNVALFSNGTRVGTTTNSTSTNLTNYYISTYNTSPGAYNAKNAYISNIRMSNVAVYDPTLTTYTVPTAPFVPSASTVLLMGNVSGSFLADSSASSLILSSTGGSPAWNQLSPFATGLGYKNRVYTWTQSGSITF
jgi:hypothetical protein